ncbi:hypothetical protein [Streptomyces orinoci]|uniref:Lipoprotein n=1 Tax=Streptomyces orinoci TaxID=67339 RepID=A0ABV3K6X8_STRON|nr:hypothetical protein [Streptomyces orinoci]
MRPLTAAIGLVAVGLLGAVLSGCGDPAGLKVTGPAASPATGPVTAYVLEAPGRPELRRPDSFLVGGTVHLTGLRWRSWDGPNAEGSGQVSGTWCMPECGAHPYRAEVRLSRLVRQDRSAYYSRAVVIAEGLPPEQQNELRDLRLFVPKR